jgi:beta-lysine 5,6-aminomutase alpha subunit
VVAEARRLAALAAEPVIEMARSHTTVSVERATLRLAGLSGATRRASRPARATAPSPG